MIGKIRTVIIGVTVKSRFPQSGPGKADDIIIAALVHYVHHYNNAIGRTLFVPAMEREDLSAIVKMVDMDILTAQSLR